jgi:excisionase family DNA binding protein
MAENDHLNNVEEAGGRLRLSRSKTYEEIGSGRLRSVKVGSRRLIPEAAIIDYINVLADADEGAEVPHHD